MESIAKSVTHSGANAATRQGLTRRQLLQGAAIAAAAAGCAAVGAPELTEPKPAPKPEPPKAPPVRYARGLTLEQLRAEAAEARRLVKACGWPVATLELGGEPVSVHLLTAALHTADPWTMDRGFGPPPGWEAGDDAGDEITGPFGWACGPGRPYNSRREVISSNRSEACRAAWGIVARRVQQADLLEGNTLILDFEPCGLATLC